MFFNKRPLFSEKFGQKSAKKPPGSCEPGGFWLLWKMIYQRFAVSL